MTVQHMMLIFAESGVHETLAENVTTPAAQTHQPRFQV